MDRPVAAPRHCRRYVAASGRAAVVLGRRRQPRDSGRSPPSTARGQPDGADRRHAVGPGVQLLHGRAGRAHPVEGGPGRAAAGGLRHHPRDRRPGRPGDVRHRDADRRAGPRAAARSTGRCVRRRSGRRSARTGDRHPGGTLRTALPYLDAQTILRLVAWPDAVAAIERVLLDVLDPAAGPQRSIVDVSHGQLLLMPGTTQTGVGVKLATVAPENADRGLPRTQAVYVLYDPVTLTVTALMDGTALTTLRTPAVSAVAVDHLAVPSARRLVVFGSGPQAWGHVQAIRAVRPVEEVVVVARQRPGAERLAGRITDSGLAAVVGGAGGVAAGGGVVGGGGDVATADVVVCATTARTPLFDGELLPAHACVVAVGSHEAEARELDDTVLRRAGRVVVEHVAVAMREAGDVVQAVASGAVTEDGLIGLRDLVRLTPAGTGGAVTSVGMGWQDLAVAELAHRRWQGHCDV